MSEDRGIVSTHRLFGQWGLETLTTVSETASRIALLLGGVLYVVGLIIVNVHFGQYGLSNLGFLRTEYVMAGTLWAFLIGSTYVTVSFMLYRFDAVARMKRTGVRLRPRIKHAALAVLVPLAIVDLFLSVITWGELPTVFSLSVPNPARRILIILLFTALFIRITGDFALGTVAPWTRLVLRSTALTHDDGARALWWRSFLSALIFGSLVLGLLASYSLYAYPLLPRSLGGGQSLALDLVIKPQYAASLRSLGVTPSATDGTLGSVELISEGPEDFVIGVNIPGQPNRVRVLRIRKNEVEAATYVTNRKPVFRF